MKLLDIVHPAAKTLVDIAKSQDAEVGHKVMWLQIMRLFLSLQVLILSKSSNIVIAYTL